MATSTRMNATCWSCGWRVHRLNIGYTDWVDRYQNFDTDDDGAWVRDPVTGYMRRLGKEAITDLDRYSLHKCREDETALD